MLLLLLLVTFDDIQANYYSDESWRIAAVQVESLDFEGDSLHWAVNYIARANYKQANYGRGLRLVEKHLDPHLESMPSNLYWDVLGLKALLAKNIGRLEQADSLYQKVIRGDGPEGVLYRAHLNYADLLRLVGQQSKRMEHLEAALELAETTRERDRTLRVMCRYYFNIELNYNAARQMITMHTPLDSIQNPETRAGYLLLVAQFSESQAQYERAAEYYRLAMRQSRQAGFLSFLYEASDGVARSKAMQRRKAERNYQSQIFIILGLALVGLGWSLNYLINRKIDARG